MESAATVAQARSLSSALPRPLGFVPTMGALHEGHLELVRRARERCAAVVASVFVNPLQFAPSEDLATYPRDLEHDREKLAAAGVDALFEPGASAMYPAGFSTFVEVEPLSARFEGAQRPGHFRGVTTVIVKLLNIVQPDALFLGQKDAQQAVLLRKMIADLDYLVDVEVVPTVREPDGLARSSRNRYLDSTRRAEAVTLYQALCTTKRALEGGARKADALAAGAAALSPGAQLDYLDVVDAEAFEPIEELRPPAFVIGAARFGATRLIDNLWVPK
ncbi:MAG TPA: pantoate--beta-alanine ligase [Candidatus Cybelea sp.]|jgi:pantoate--beta-alanine ligase|nr:pantoate--beta-alanine ligase [Candidatus Cybelea sp.]